MSAYPELCHADAPPLLRYRVLFDGGAVVDVVAPRDDRDMRKWLSKETSGSLGGIAGIARLGPAADSARSTLPPGSTPLDRIDAEAIYAWLEEHGIAREFVSGVTPCVDPSGVRVTLWIGYPHRPFPVAMGSYRPPGDMPKEGR